MTFRDRTDAGRQLAAALERYRDGRPVVLALPRGGVPVAREVADALHAPLDLLLVRKLGLPYQPELAMGAVVDAKEPIVVRNPEVLAMSGIGEAEFDRVLEAELTEMKRRRELYLGGREPPDLSGRTVIVIDDGIATGATMRAALRALRQAGAKKIVLAVPVTSPSALEQLSEDADDIVCIERNERFGAIGYYYEDFSQVSDDEVIEALRST